LRHVFNWRSGLPLDSNETQYALHIGLEHRFNNVVSVFGRAARAFRSDRRRALASGPAFDLSSIRFRDFS
jgi:iron complex outermembrane receptor protein